MYKIIGADQKEYGPISADQIRQWIAEGRVNGQTQVCAEGSQEWKSLETFPEFGFTANPAPGAPPMPASDRPPVPIEEILAQDYTIDIMSCFSRAGALFKDNFGTVFVTFLLFVVLVFAAGGTLQMVLVGTGENHLPVAKQIYFGPIRIIFTSLLSGPAVGGIFFVYLSIIRGQYVGAGELFTGFKSFQDLFLAKLIPSMITFACTFPYTYATTMKLAPYLDKLQENPNPASVNPMEVLTTMMSAYTSSLPLFLICLVPSLYLYVNWQFTTPLIIDRKLGFWGGLMTSWRIVHKHWFQIFGLVVLTGLINVAGFFMCCVGLLVTVPFSLLVVCYAYEDIFGRKAA